MSRQAGYIFLNDNIVSHTSGRGVTRYFREVADGIIDQFGSKVVICSPESRDYGAAKHIRSLRFRGGHRLKVHDMLASVAAFRERASVFFSPYYGSARTSAAEVFTVHDMIFELFPHYFPRTSSYIQRSIKEKRRCMERASALIAVSESTARDIVTCYPHVNADKITVIYHGVSDFFFETSARQHGVGGKPFFLYVGNRILYKNFLRVLSAFGQSGLGRDFDLRVISPTVDGFSPHEAECLDRYQLRGSVHLMSAVDDAVLRQSYQAAVAFVYPSEYEGFGLPILEAMASGTIVATSNRSSMPEVGGDVAFYFDPTDADSIADCLRQVADLPARQRSDRIALGIARAKTFTWSRCQQQTVDLLRRFV